MTKKQSTKQLDDISETMLITVWARAVETKRNLGLLHDPVAVDVIDQIDYDFSVFEKAKLSQAGCCIRSRQIDEMTCNFIAQHPDAVVIQLGAGLDTRYQRLGCPNITHWYDLDLEHAIAMRESLCPTHEKNSLLALSFLDEKWIDIVQTHNKPVLIILEGVLMYFDEDQVKGFFTMLCRRFSTATVLFDMLPYLARGHAKHHDSVKRTKNRAEFKWSLDDSSKIETWHANLHLVKEKFMSDYAGKRFGLFMRILYKIPYIYKNLNQRTLHVEISN